MGRPKTQLNRRAEIVEAARELFAQKGFEKTTIDEIAKSVGIGKGSVYLEFQNKDDIYLEIIEEFVRNLFAKRKHLIENSTPPHLLTLKNIVIDNIKDVFEITSTRMRTYVSQFHTNYIIKQKLSDLIEENTICVASLLDKAGLNKEIPEGLDHKYLISVLNVILHGFVPPYDFRYLPEYRTDKSVEEIQEELMTDITTVMEIFLSGIKSGYHLNMEKRNI